MRSAAIFLAGVALAACRGASPEGEVRLTVRRQQLDPVELRAPMTAVRCSSGAGLLLRGVADLQGVLVWLVTANTPDTGAFPVHASSAALTGRHARVSVRYATGDDAQSFGLDSGTVVVRRDAAGLGGTIGAAGSESGGGARALVDAAFHGVRVTPDSEPCRIVGGG